MWYNGDVLHSKYFALEVILGSLLGINAVVWLFVLVTSAQCQ
jgi:hypothetical protein